MLIMPFLGVLLALFILYIGAELTLTSAEKIGFHLGLSPLAIGVVIIGFGTSLPELFVSQVAGWSGKPDLAIGNLVGSNITNSLLILGVASLFTTIPMLDKMIKGQLYFHLFLHALLFMALARGPISPFLQLGLLLLFTTYIIYSVLNDKKLSKTDIEQAKDLFKYRLIVYLLMGLVFLYAGGELLVSQGTLLGVGLGVSEYLISVIFISFGTSFPELITTIVACYKKKDESLIVGNIVGSNFFNLSFILGSLVFYKVQIGVAPKVEMLVLCALSLVLIFIYKFVKRIPRLMSIPLLLSYVAMVYYWVDKG